ncbi:MAG: metallophosphatase [Clostridiales bacterium]|nr:metallophosphatase [Clostridiales bacterium]
MLYITGDTHGILSINRLNSRNFPEGQHLTKNDYVLITGDFGLVFLNNHVEKCWRKWLDDSPWTTLFIDGNHENHGLLDSYPITDWRGGKIHVISDSIFHLMRGQVYTLAINDFKAIKIFTFGGADSDDKQWRTGASWWSREMPSKAEYEEGIGNLERHNWEVDYVFSHTVPTSCLSILNDYRIIPRLPNRLTHFLQMIYNKTTFTKWYHGHMHVDLDYKMGKVRAIYEDIVVIDN